MSTNILSSGPSLKRLNRKTLSTRPNANQSLVTKPKYLLESVLLRIFKVVRWQVSRIWLKNKLKPNSKILDPVDATLEQAHLHYWAPLGKVSPLWLRYYVNVSGIEDRRYVPGDVLLFHD
ncbi:MAG: hypothetical protein AB8B86_00305 [Pseudomonadales bacterium]